MNGLARAVAAEARDAVAAPAGYRVCAACLMDTTDPDITFDAEGVCSHCHRHREAVRNPKLVRRLEPGALEALVADIRRQGRGRRYDCIIGVSGGVDSTYVAWKVKALGLRPLAAHLDNGWDSELAVGNIERTLKQLDIDLDTHVLDWREFSDLQRAFLAASTSDLEIPTDHAIYASLYAAAAREGVRHILSGHNMATESGGVTAWAQGHADWRYIAQIHRRFGTVPLATYPRCGVLEFVRYAVIGGIRWVPILDYMEYRKADAVRTLQEALGWRDYGGKHHESIFTRFYLRYFLPVKFGVDIRRLHLSSLIWSGQLSREAALEELAEDDYPTAQQESDRDYVVKKLGLTRPEFDRLMALPRRTFHDYPSYKRLVGRVRPLMAVYHRFRR
ncbi:MAG: N-acetyl sugar amidotransferase [Acidimicrobiia bacterium]|nr:N-acetyl sugar amidotransferase [Acidimicrobiia bacterium]